MGKVPMKHGRTYCTMVVETPRANSPENLPSSVPSSCSASMAGVALFAYPRVTGKLGGEFMTMRNGLASKFTKLAANTLNLNITLPQTFLILFLISV